MDVNITLQEGTEGTLEETKKCQLMNAENATDDNNTLNIKKKEISWNVEEYLQTAHLQEIGVRSNGLAVERKASIGPHFQSTSSIGGPSGITICIPKKSRKGINEDLNTMTSVINLTVSKKNINTFMAQSYNAHGQNKLDLKIGDAPNATFFGALRGRIHEIRDKIRNTLIK